MSIVVGVDGSTGSRIALLWAASEATRRGARLIMVHGHRSSHAQLLRSFDVSTQAALGHQRDHLRTLESTVVHSHNPSVAVTTVIRDEAPAEALIELSHEADLVVVGVRGNSDEEGRVVDVRTALGSVSHRVATRAACPVVIVPETWDVDRPERQRIVLGVSPSESGRLALGFALDEAALRHATVVALRAWDAATSDVLDGTVGDAELAERRLLAETAAPGDVQRQFVHDDPVRALIEAGEDADLLVTGSYHSPHLSNTRLGPVPTGLVHRAHCPVVVIGQGMVLADAAAGVPGAAR